MHQFPFYPGTGSHLDNKKNVLNIPLSSGTSRISYIQLFHKKVVPFIKKFSPDILIVSAGFDAHKLDPLASLNLLSIDYAEMIYECKLINPFLLVGLEGGYHLDAQTESLIEILKILV